MRASWVVLATACVLAAAGCSSPASDSQAATTSVTVSVTTTAPPLTQTQVATPVTQTETVAITETVVTTEIRRHLVVKIESIDHATGSVTLVKQILTDPELTQEHLTDDVADPTVYTLQVDPQAEIGLIFTPCGTRDDLARDGLIPCTIDDFAAVIDQATIYAEIEASDTTLFWAHEIYQA